MTREFNTHGGGDQTNKNGLEFERATSLDDVLTKAGYKINNYIVYNKHGERIGLSVPQRKFYSEFLEPNNINYSDYNSKRWLPDEAFVNERNKTLYIIEKKYQGGAGSVDEKLPGCGFKKLEYEKLVAPLGFKVHFIYILCHFFHDNRYRDTFEYIKNVNCEYYFYQDENKNVIPISLSIIGLEKDDD